MTDAIAQQTSFMPSVLMFLLAIVIEMQTRAVAQSPSPSIGSVLTTPSGITSPSPGKPFIASLARDPAGEPSTVFTTETPTIYLRWQAQDLNTGDKIRCIWIAENVGKAAPANYHVDETVMTANKSQTTGIFTVSKPKADWPAGKYRAEIYVGTQLVAALAFTIEEPRGD